MGFAEDFDFFREFGVSDKYSIEDTFETVDFSKEEVEDGKPLAVLAYLPFLCFIPYIKAKDNNRFAFEHGKQGILLFLFEAIVLVGVLFWKVALFAAAVVALIGMIYALMGKAWRIPFIGSLSGKIHTIDNNDSDQ
ncbi:MAG: hypothetical protein ACLFSQ_04645 [Candidatus Zixiibacteriota bacterium]